MEHFDHRVLDQAWASGQPPAILARAGRVKLLGEFSRAALSGREPSRESMLFVAGAIQAWLSQGGDLSRDYFQVTGPAGSHHTPAALWQTLCDGSSEGEQDLDDEATI